MEATRYFADRLQRGAGQSSGVSFGLLADNRYVSAMSASPPKPEIFRPVSAMSAFRPEADSLDWIKAN